MKVVDIGCGPNKTPGALGVDRVDCEGVDVIVDLAIFPWPFEDGEFDVVISNHFLEHCEDLETTISELHRITKRDTGSIRVRCPHYSSWNYYADITHRTPFSIRSFDHFLLNDSTGYNYYSAVKFNLNRRRIHFVSPKAKHNPWKWLGIDYLANKYSRFYERLFAFTIPCTEVEFDLSPISLTQNHNDG